MSFQSNNFNFVLNPADQSLNFCTDFGNEKRAGGGKIVASLISREWAKAQTKSSMTGYDNIRKIEYTGTEIGSKKLSSRK